MLSSSFLGGAAFVALLLLVVAPVGAWIVGGPTCPLFDLALQHRHDAGHARGVDPGSGSSDCWRTLVKYHTQTLKF